ncbi:N-acetyltransferase Eis [Streptomyces microflavus]
MEVGAALEARAYRTPVDVVLEVEDAFCPWNAGRWHLVADAKGGASCRRAPDRAPDLELSVRELGAAYLGGVSFTSLAAAGAGAGGAAGSGGGGLVGVLVACGAVGAAAQIAS